MEQPKQTIYFIYFHLICTHVRYIRDFWGSNIAGRCAIIRFLRSLHWRTALSWDLIGILGRTTIGHWRHLRGRRNLLDAWIWLVTLDDHPWMAEHGFRGSIPLPPFHIIYLSVVQPLWKKTHDMIWYDIQGSGKHFRLYLLPIRGYWCKIRGYPDDVTWPTWQSAKRSTFPASARVCQVTPIPEPSTKCYHASACP